MATKQRQRQRAATPPSSPAVMPVLGPDDVTSASQWRTGSKQGFVIELPSGFKARVKRTMNLLSLLEKGKIPNPLAGSIKQMIASQSPMPSLGGDDAQEMLPQLLELVNSQIKRIFVEPRVESEPADWDEDDDGEWEPSEGAISLDDINMQDRMYAFAFAQGMALDLEAFRRQQASAMATLQDVGGVAGEAEQPASPGGPVPGVVSGRGDVDVRESRGTSDEPSGAGSGQASAEAGSEAEGADGSAEGAGDGDD